MKPLYEYANEYQRVINLIEECEEITPELMDMLDNVSNDSKNKIVNVSAVIKNFELLSKNIDDAIINMKKRKIQIKSKINKIKNYLKYNMETLKLTKVNTPEFDIKLRYNNYSLDIFNTDLIPFEYFREKISQFINKEQIIKDLKNDVLIPGAQFKKTSTVKIK